MKRFTVCTVGQTLLRRTNKLGFPGMCDGVTVRKERAAFHLRITPESTNRGFLPAPHHTRPMGIGQVGGQRCFSVTFQ